MSKPPDDFNIPDDAMPPDDDGDEKHDENQPVGPAGPPGQKRRKVKVINTQSAQEVKFSDMFGFTLSPAHGIVKFGVFHPESGEFVVHTQVAMTPQGMVTLAQSLQKNIEKMRKMKPGGGQRLN